MKTALHGVLIFAFSILSPMCAWTETVPKTPEKPLKEMFCLPGDNEIPGWRRSEMFLRASNEEELYRIINGGASLYIQHGFRSYVGQTYKGPKGTELEVHIFNQETHQNALDLFENPFAKPSQIKNIADLGEKARIDESALFCYGVDYIQGGFFVRVIIQDRSDEGLKAAISFARFVSDRIK